MSEEAVLYRYEPIALSDESTVVGEYLPEPHILREAGYQSEAALEQALIA